MNKRFSFLFACFFMLAALVACGGTNSSSEPLLVLPSSDSKAPNEKGYMIDPRDGQVYKTVKIGDQVWMAENLNYETVNVHHYKDADICHGEECGYIRLTAGCYDAHASNCVKYGGLYRWSYAKTACPEGWHLPDTTEWNKLISVVGWDSAGKMLKSKTDWYGNGNGTDDYGFSALPVGISSFAIFNADPYALFINPYTAEMIDERLPDYVSPDRFVFFWSSTDAGEDEVNQRDAYGVFLSYYQDGMYVGRDAKSFERPVRCIQNSSVMEDVSLSVFPQSVSSVTPDTMSSSSRVTLSPASSSSWSVIDSQSLSMPLAPDLFRGIGSMIDPRDGQTYRTVSIGSQKWMAENLKYKTDESYCLGDNDSNCTKYGRLYKWDAVKNACPTGWHVPIEKDWDLLFFLVGGAISGGTALKSKTGWLNHGNGTDDYGFSALPAGFRFGDGTYTDDGRFAFFWSSTEFSQIEKSEQKDYAYLIYLYYYYESVDLSADYKNLGLSIRCVNDTLKESVYPKPELDSSMTDPRDGRVYKTVTIGKQTWMAENLNYATVNSYCYKNEPGYCTQYGRLYTWSAAIDSLNILHTKGQDCGYDRFCSLKHPVQGVCPAGWHLPSEKEWKYLFAVARGDSVLKSQTGWLGGLNGTDDFGFNALPAGDKDIDGRFLVGYSAIFWSSTEMDAFDAYRKVVGRHSKIDNDKDKKRAFSVRCVKDTARVESKDDGAITPHSASSVTPHSVSSTVIPDLIGNLLTDSRDGQIYRTVTIGNQTWMAQNLNYKTEKSSCDDDSTDFCNINGRYYKWEVAKDACPEDWHLPTEAEWDTLFNTVGGDSLANRTLKSALGWNGWFCFDWFSEFGMNSIPDCGNGTDSYGFMALPTGEKMIKDVYPNSGLKRKKRSKKIDRSFSANLIGSYFAAFWNTGVRSFIKLRQINSERIEKGHLSNEYGLPIRCIKNRGESKIVSPASSSSWNVIDSQSLSMPLAPDLFRGIGSMVDSRDGQTYRTVTIGKQTWMAQNLNYETSDSYCYGDFVNNCSKYGRLYKWAVANDACPAGYHLPSPSEWITLFDAVGGTSVAVSKLKAKNSWFNGGYETDDYGFSILPSGERQYDGKYSNEGVSSYFWTDLDEKNQLYKVYLDYFDNAVRFENVNDFKGIGVQTGVSIRCVKGDAQRKKKQSTLIPKTSKTKKEKKFIKGSMKDRRDGQTYKTVTIGGQTWMAQNLNYKTEESYCFKDSLKLCKLYGRYYTEPAAREACPAGWHLPAESEWNALFSAVGGKSVAGRKLRSIDGWIDAGGGMDAYSFAALPGGFRDRDGNFKNDSESAHFLIRTNDHRANLLLMYGGLGSVSIEYDKDRFFGYNVRCVKD